MFHGRQLDFTIVSRDSREREIVQNRNSKAETGTVDAPNSVVSARAGGAKLD